MRITITTLSDNIFTLEVNDELELENFKALCEFECGVPANEITLLWNGRPLTDSKTTLKAYGIKEGDMLLLQQIRGRHGQPRSPQSTNVPGNRGSPGSGRPMAIDFGSIRMPGTSGAGASGVQTSPNNPDPAHIREMLLSNPHELSILKERNPPLAEALLSGSLDKFKEVFNKQHKEHVERERERHRLLHSNPFDPAVQEKIEEEIRLKNVETNMETAMEYAPESFGQVVMLYINCRVNGHDVKSFVDSGAQMTIMSQECAQRCGINRLVDTRWAGVAKGVGTQKIIGRVHLGQIQIGNDFLQSSFSILEDQPMDMLLGLDMLKRHQCCIDLKRNLLIIGTTGTETLFLNESELPSHARLNLSQSKSVEDEDRQLAEALSRSAAESGNKNNSNTGAASVSESTYPPEVISRLASYGFSQQQIVDQLKLSNGNVDEALAALLAGSITMPKPKN